jgi:hypothetical protein
MDKNIIVDSNGSIYSSKSWIGVDFDGTLAKLVPWDGKGQMKPGAPIKLMVERVKKWIEDGINVKILTARVCSMLPEDEIDEGRRLIEEFCMENIGVKLEVTSEKDIYMLELWDDRAVQVIPNTGLAVRRVK